MIHVGTESALAGSVAHTPCGRLGLGVGLDSGLGLGLGLGLGPGGSGLGPGSPTRPAAKQEVAQVFDETDTWQEAGARKEAEVAEVDTVAEVAKAEVACGRLPTPPSQAVCTSAPPGAPTATADSAAAAPWLGSGLGSGLGLGLELGLGLGLAAAAPSA